MRNKFISIIIIVAIVIVSVTVTVMLCSNNSIMSTPTSSEDVTFPVEYSYTSDTVINDTAINDVYLNFIADYCAEYNTTVATQNVRYYGGNDYYVSISFSDGNWGEFRYSYTGFGVVHNLDGIDIYHWEE